MGAVRRRLVGGSWYRSRPIVRGIGLLLHVPAAMALLSIPVCVVFTEWRELTAFAITAVVCILIGQALYQGARGGAGTERHHAMMVAAVGWLIVSAAAALPFVLVAYSGGQSAAASLGDPLNAMFETLSGFTTTGLSMVDSPSHLSHALQWWRSLTAWVGGVGVIVLMLSVMPSSVTALNLFYSEGREQKILPSVRSTTFAIWTIYLLYTVVSVAILWLAGDPLWRALNHAMNGIATCSFTITDDSLRSASPLLKLAYVPVMVFGTIGFATHYRVVREGKVLSGLFGGAEQRLLWTLLVGGALLVVFEQAWFTGHVEWVDPVVQWVSAVTTSGFYASDINGWPAATLLVMILGMLVGSMAGSTGGGIKVLRIVTVFKGFIWNMRQLTSKPHEVLRYRFDGDVLTPDQADHLVRAAATLIAAWLVVLTVGVLLLLHLLPVDTSFESVLFLATAAQGNAGLSAGVAIAHIGIWAKVVLMALMWVGRLEMVPVMILAIPLLSRRL